MHRPTKAKHQNLLKMEIILFYVSWNRFCKKIIISVTSRRATSQRGCWRTAPITGWAQSVEPRWYRRPSGSIGGRRIPAPRPLGGSPPPGNKGRTPPETRHVMMSWYGILVALCEGNPPASGGFPSQRTSNAKLLMMSSVLSWTSSWKNSWFSIDLKHHGALVASV